MNPFRTIWYQPQRTFEEFILNNEDQSLFATPLLLMGLSIGIDKSADLTNIIGERWAGLLIGIPAGIGISFLVLGLIAPGLIKLFGRIWKGPATMRQVVNVCSMSSIPFTLILIHQVVLVILGQNGTTAEVNQGIYYVLWLWSFSLTIIGVATVQRFSYGIALLNILLSQLPIVILGLLRT